MKAGLPGCTRSVKVLNMWKVIMMMVMVIVLMFNKGTHDECPYGRLSPSAFCIHRLTVMATVPFDLCPLGKGRSAYHNLSGVSRKSSPPVRQCSFDLCPLDEVALGIVLLGVSRLDSR